VRAGLGEAEGAGDQLQFVSHEVKAQYAGRLDARVRDGRAARPQPPDSGRGVDLTGESRVRENHACALQLRQTEQRVRDLLRGEAPFALCHAIARLARPGSRGMFCRRHVVFTHRQPTPNAVIPKNATVNEITTTTVVQPIALYTRPFTCRPMIRRSLMITIMKMRRNGSKTPFTA